MLEEICRHLQNWFCKDADKLAGDWVISNGSITIPGIVSGQYFRIIGSKLNDGVYAYPVSDGELADEEFTGEIWIMSVPKPVQRIVSDAEEYSAKFGDASPYTSESFGGYSYSRATNSHGEQITWHRALKSRLDPWRKA